jgi:hypothetical protein
VIGFIFAIKLYIRKKGKEANKEKYIEQIYQAEESGWLEDDDDEETLGRRSSVSNHHLSLPPASSQSGSSNGSRKLQLSSLLDPGSQFSLAIQRASEIPNTPTTTEEEEAVRKN